MTREIIVKKNYRRYFIEAICFVISILEFVVFSLVVVMVKLIPKKKG